MPWVRKYPGHRFYILDPAFAAGEIDEDGEEGEHDDDKRDRDYVFLTIGDYRTERKTESDHAHAPEKSADDVVREEFSVGHGAGAREDRRKRPHDRHEAREDEGASAVLLIETLGALEIFLLEKPRILAILQMVADLRAEPVASRVTQYRCDDDGQHKGTYGEKSAGRKESCGKEE